MPSSIGPARANLHAALAASSALDGVQVAFGSPDDYEEQEVVSVLGFGPVGDEPAAIGQRRQEEQYRIDVGIKVHNPAADSAAEVETRAMALYDALRDVVVADATLGEAVTFCVPAGMDESPGPQSVKGGGWAMWIVAGIECVARIS